MSFKLDKTELEILKDCILSLQSSQTRFKESRISHIEEVEAFAELLVDLEEAEDFRDEIATVFRDEFEERSDKWKESERGEEINEQIEEWENVDFSEPDLEEGSELEDYAQILEALPTNL